MLSKPNKKTKAFASHAFCAQVALGDAEEGDLIPESAENLILAGED